MTRQETFKRRIRQRMEKTGERYGAARRVLIEQSSSSGKRGMGVRARDGRRHTARGHRAWLGRVVRHHRRLARSCRRAHRHRHLSSATSTEWRMVGPDRDRGIRADHRAQSPPPAAGRDFQRGQVTNGDSRCSVPIREMLLDDDDRADLFPGLETELRSRPNSKVLRIGIGPGRRRSHSNRRMTAGSRSPSPMTSSPRPMMSRSGRATGPNGWRQSTEVESLRDAASFADHLPG